jgi:hypothetical protein
MGPTHRATSKLLVHSRRLARVLTAGRLVRAAATYGREAGQRLGEAGRGVVLAVMFVESDDHDALVVGKRCEHAPRVGEVAAAKRVVVALDSGQSVTAGPTTFAAQCIARCLIRTLLAGRHPAKRRRHLRRSEDLIGHQAGSSWPRLSWASPFRRASLSRASRSCR